MNKKNFPPHIVDGGASYQKKVEEAPYHPGYEDAVVTPAPKYTGMDPDKMLWKPKQDTSVAELLARIAELEKENELLHKAMNDAFNGLESSLELNKVLLKEKSK